VIVEGEGERRLHGSGSSTRSRSSSIGGLRNLMGVGSESQGRLGSFSSSSFGGSGNLAGAKEAQGGLAQQRENRASEGMVRVDHSSSISSGNGLPPVLVGGRPHNLSVP